MILDTDVDSTLRLRPESDAHFSECGKYRYMLCRYIGPGPELVVCMLNPSRAGKTENDPTVRWLMSYCRRHGYGSLKIVNLSAYVTPFPEELKVVEDPIGPGNRDILLDTCRGRDVLCAWGAGVMKVPALLDMASLVVTYAKCAYVLGKTKGGHPWHPLRKRLDLEMKVWR